MTAEREVSDAGARTAVAAARPSGPYDADERGDVPTQENEVDLGALTLVLKEGVGLRVEVDKKSGRANRVMLLTEDSAVQIVVVAAPRSRSYWDEVWPAIAENATGAGGTAEEEESEFGTALAITMPVKAKDGSPALSENGKPVVQPSYVVGIDGPRWMLRATFLGRAAFVAEPRAELMEIVRSIVVHRGGEAKLPGEPLVMTPAAPPSGGSLVMESTGDVPVRPAGGSDERDGGDGDGDGTDAADPEAT